MKLQSCQNCWFNALQYGSIGLAFGYCVRHRKVLNLADETTCGQQVRKDLTHERAKQVSGVHSTVFDDDKIVRISTRDEVSKDFSSLYKDAELLREDRVADAVMDYGSITKIGSLAQLKSLETARSDLAMTSLGRAYVRNCAANGGGWTSGLHLYWWTKKRISYIPEVGVRDLRYSGLIQLHRQTELAKWSIMMFKLTLLDDIVSYAFAQEDELGCERGIVNRAAEEVQSFNSIKLRVWIHRKLLPSLDARLGRERYEALADELRNSADPADVAD